MRRVSIANEDLLEGMENGELDEKTFMPQGYANLLRYKHTII